MAPGPSTGQRKDPGVSIPPAPVPAPQPLPFTDHLRRVAAERLALSGQWVDIHPQGDGITFAVHVASTCNRFRYVGRLIVQVSPAGQLLIEHKLPVGEASTAPTPPPAVSRAEARQALEEGRCGPGAAADDTSQGEGQ